MAARVEIDFAAKNASSVVNAATAADRAIRALNQRGEENYRTTRQQAAEIRRVRAAFRDQAAAAKEAGKITESLRTPQESYAASVKALRGHLEAGRISEETYQRARKQLQQQTLQSTDAEKARSAAMAEAAAITERTRTPEEQHAERVNRLNALLDEGRLSEETHARAVQQATEALDRSTGATQRREQADREAKRTIESLLTPQDRYAQQVRALKSQQASGRITQEQYSQAVRNARKTLDDATGATERKRRAEQAAQAVIERTRTATERYDIEVRELRRHLDEGRLSQTQFSRAMADAESRLLAAERGGNRMVGTLGRMAAGFVTVATAARAIRAVGRELSEFETSVDDVSERFEEQKVKLQIQAGIDEDQLAAEVPVVFEQLKKTPTTNVFAATAAQRQLVSSGFSPEDVQSGEALDTVLQLQAATNQFGEGSSTPQDAARGIRSISQFRKGLDGNDVAPTAEAIKSTGAKVTKLFEGSDIQFTDLEEIAKQAGGLRAKGLDEDTILASFSALVDVKGGAEGATGMRQVVDRLRSAANRPAAAEALNEIGLDPKQIDLIDEDFLTALDRLSEALDKADPAAASKVLLKVFEEQGAASAQTLLDSRETIRKRVDDLGGAQASFDRNVEIFRRSEFATKQRSQNDADVARLNLDTQRGGVSFKELRQMVDTALAEQNAGDTSRSQRLANASAAASIKTIISVQEASGGSPEEAVLAVSQTPLVGESDLGKRFSERANQRGQDGFLFSQKALDASTEQGSGQSKPDQEETARQAVAAAVAGLTDDDRAAIVERFDSSLDHGRLRRGYDPLAAAQEFLVNHSPDIDRLGGDSNAGLARLQPVAPAVADVDQEPAEAITLPAIPPNLIPFDQEPASRVVVPPAEPNVADAVIEPAQRRNVAAVTPAVDDVEQEPAGRVGVSALTPEVNAVDQEPADRVVVPPAEPDVADAVIEPAQRRNVAAVTPAVDDVQTQPPGTRRVETVTPAVDDVEQEPAGRVGVSALTPEVNAVDQEPAGQVVVPPAEPDVADAVIEPAQRRNVAAVTPAVDDMQTQPRDSIEAFLEGTADRRQRGENDKQTTADDSPERSQAPERIVVSGGLASRDLQPLERSATERNGLLSRMLSAFERNNELLAELGRELNQSPAVLPSPARRPAGNRAALLDRRARS